LNSEELRSELEQVLMKNEFFIKDKLSIVDEMLLQLETLQRQVKTN